ncbi:MAG: cyclic nucleotide-binding domain-containing protein [Terracidiphilus sp.]
MNLDPSAFVADPELIDGLEGQSTGICCVEETVLFRQGDPPSGIYILKSGSVTLTMTSPANSEALSLGARPGSLLGLPAVIGEAPYTLTAVAHPGAHLSYVPRETFAHIMGHDRALALKILRVLAAEVRTARTAILEQGPSAAPRRSRLTPSRQA